jgi:hypothetical protein
LPSRGLGAPARQTNSMKLLARPLLFTRRNCKSAFSFGVKKVEATSESDRFKG